MAKLHERNVSEGRYNDRILVESVDSDLFSIMMMQCAKYLDYKKDKIPDDVVLNRDFQLSRLMYIPCTLHLITAEDKFLPIDWMFQYLFLPNPTTCSQVTKSYILFRFI